MGLVKASSGQRREVGGHELPARFDREQALGARYDLRDFDDAVVKGGNVPMDVLAKNVDDYIAIAGARAAR